MNKPKTRDENIVVQELANEILIYDLEINKAYCLNETSAQIWQLCDGTRTVAEISRSLTKKLKQPITEDVIWLALDGFKKDNLLEQSEQFAIDFNGLNRRQIIKKIGFASMVALPLVASIIAPSAAMAQSGGNLALFAACSAPSQCASGSCITCQNGQCNGSPVCCAAGAFPNARGTGINFFGCIDKGTCSSSGSFSCCSGQTTFTVTNCDGNPGYGTCACK